MGKKCLADTQGLHKDSPRVKAQAVFPQKLNDFGGLANLSKGRCYTVL